MRFDGHLLLLPQRNSDLLRASLSARESSTFALRIVSGRLLSRSCSFSLGRSLSSGRRQPDFGHGKASYCRSFFIQNDGISNVVAYSGCPDSPSQAQGFESFNQLVEDFKRMAQYVFHVLVLDRYLLREMAPPFLAALAVGSILGMSLGAFVSLAREVVTSGLPLRVALVASFLQLPHFLSQTMPAACMAASLFSLNRLQGDMELLAMFATGVPIRRLLRAPFYLGVLGAIIQLACTEYVVPFANERAVNMIQSFFTTDIYTHRQRDDVIYPEYDKRGGSQKIQRVWYAKRFEGDLMSGVLMLDFSESGRVKRVLIADECEHVPNQQSLKFIDSTIIDINVNSVKHRIVQVKTLEVPGPIVLKSVIGRLINMQSLSRHHISLCIESLNSKLKAEFGQISKDNLSCKSFKKENIGSLSTVSGQSRLKWPVDINLQHKASIEESLVKAECNLLQHDASICSCIVFTMVGTISMLTVGQIESRSQAHSSPFVVSIICAGIYNSTVTLAAVAGHRKLLSPIMSAWLPFLLALLLGLCCIIWKILQEAT